MKYLPVETDPVDASQWKHDDVYAVQEFLVMLSFHGLRYMFESEDMESWDVEVHVFDGGLENPATVVGHRKWLIIHSNGTLETMADAAFAKTYRLA